MIITENKLHVVRAEWDGRSKNYWWKIRLDIPELHFETPNLNTQEYAYDLIEKILKTDKCPHCGKDI